MQSANCERSWRPRAQGTPKVMGTGRGLVVAVDEAGSALAESPESDDLAQELNQTLDQLHAAEIAREERGFERLAR